MAVSDVEDIEDVEEDQKNREEEPIAGVEGGEAGRRRVENRLSSLVTNELNSPAACCSLVDEDGVSGQESIGCEDTLVLELAAIPKGNTTRLLRSTDTDCKVLANTRAEEGWMETFPPSWLDEDCETALKLRFPGSTFKARSEVGVEGWNIICSLDVTRGCILRRILKLG